MERFHAIVIYNERFYNPKHYRDNPPSVLGIEYKKDSVKSRDLKKYVLDFALHSSVCKSLNISFVDLMAMDQATLEMIQKAIAERDEKVSHEQQKIAAKQEKIIGDINAK